MSVVGRYFYGNSFQYSLALQGGGTEWTHGLSLPFMAGTTQRLAVVVSCLSSRQIAPNRSRACDCGNFLQWFSSSSSWLSRSTALFDQLTVSFAPPVDAPGTSENFVGILIHHIDVGDRPSVISFTSSTLPDCWACWLVLLPTMLWGSLSSLVGGHVCGLDM